MLFTIMQKTKRILEVMLFTFRNYCLVSVCGNGFAPISLSCSFTKVEYVLCDLPIMAYLLLMGMETLHDTRQQMTLVTSVGVGFLNCESQRLMSIDAWSPQK